MERLNDTIVAPATSTGRGALALVRLDGTRAHEIVGEMTRGATFRERRATRTSLHDGDEKIDDAVVVRYCAPRSFTGNDLVEVTLHGSPFLVDRFVRAAVRRGARVAEPGEFTERAVLNGKLDLTQAEAVGALIESRTALQAKLALSHLDGELTRTAGEARSDLLFLISRFEAALDFSEEGYEFVSKGEASAIMDQALERIQRLEQSFERGRAVTNGITAVILGRPNSGKSTLMNFLCGSDRAIVTSIAGTTRDLLREPVEIGGLPVTLVDTAGLRPTTDEVESIGVARARKAAANADLVLYLVDAVEGLDDKEREELAGFSKVVVIYNKVELVPAPAGQPGVSLLQNRGTAELIRLLDELVRETFVPPEGSAAIVTQRQQLALQRSHESLASARLALSSSLTEEFVLAELYHAARALGQLTGEVTQDEIYSEIFSKFCVGK